ncbi:hypothetical protein PAPYR_9590 [Paratrimastix pyriformis]|uniref:Uncharacterized protein n=1 Tax=Paratrimastix pyriformis TaxID=342808 RepID=A0ABQ8U7Y2_9EUKA|nr:hypothetical protein PAPYR_9590 [Paratrimastix pyriformis]
MPIPIQLMRHTIISLMSPRTGLTLNAQCAKTPPSSVHILIVPKFSAVGAQSRSHPDADLKLVPVPHWPNIAWNAIIGGDYHFLPTPCLHVRSPTASVLAEPEDEAFFALPERLEKFFLTGTAPPKQQAKPVNRRAHRAKRSARDPLATATSPVPISPEECEARDITQTTPALSLTASRGGDQERLDVPAVARLDALHLTDVPPTTAHPGKVTRGAARG